MTNSLEELIRNLSKDKKFKHMTLSTGDDPSLIIKKLPFEIESLDNLLEGGLPIGKYTLIYGEFSVGKTFLIQKIIASAQQKSKSIVYIDVDKSFEPDWWKVVGVDVSNLIVAQPYYGEQVFDLAIKLIEDKFDMVVVDSLDLLVPTVEAETDVEDGTMNLSLQRAKLISKGLRMVKRVNKETTFICTNHIAEGMGGRFSQFRIPGGKAQEDFSSLMMWVSRGAHIKEDEIKKGGDAKKRVGFNMRVTLEKDKIEGKRYESCLLPFIFDGGMIDNIAGMIEIALELGIIQKNRGTYEFLDQKIFGKLNLKDFLVNNEEMQDIIKELIQNKKEER